MLARTLLALTLCAAASAHAQISAVNLANYTHTATYALPVPGGIEASAVTWNWNTNTLFVLGDEGEALIEVSKTGALISSMTLTGFSDTEGLTYVGNGKFVVGEERLQDLFLLTYAAGGSANRSALQSISLGPTVGNIGIEGFSYDPLNGKYYAVKEKSPQNVLEVSNVNFPAGTATTATLFNPAPLGVLDLSDIQVLTTVPSLLGTADEQNLLIYSQESALLMEVKRDGTLLSTFNFAGIASDAEGVTIDADGIIYIVGETPELYVLTPVPEPTTYALLAAGLGLVGWRLRRRTPADARAALALN